LARRLAIFYAAANIANAFSGLLAFAVFRIERPDLIDFRSRWRWLFIIEGSITVLFAILPTGTCRSTPAASFLTEEEKALAYHRIHVDSSLGRGGRAVHLFLPQIIQRLGTAPSRLICTLSLPTLGGAVMLIILAFLSDWRRIRGPFVALGFTFTCIVVHNNIAHEGQRLVLTSVGVPLANLMGLVPSNIFRLEDAPKYENGLITVACFCPAGALAAASMCAYMFSTTRPEQTTGRPS
ncbi:hypothetical protein MCOR02_012436, partial [Pyricularia oryzae]